MVSEVLLGSADKVDVTWPVWWISPGRGAPARALATLQQLIPLRRVRFERHLESALRDAPGMPNRFFLDGFAARRALGPALVINIDPQQVQRRLKPRAGRVAKVVCFEDKFVGAGDWEPMLEPVSASATHRDVQEIIEAGLDHRATRAYSKALRRASGRRPVRRNFIALKTPHLVDGYFLHVTDLCRSIQGKGILPRTRFRHFGHAFKNPRMRLPVVELAESDIGISIGPDGELCHFGPGKHRIAAAQAFGLKSIPVEVRLVHLTWLQSQISIYGCNPVDALLAGIQRLHSPDGMATNQGTA